MCRQSEQLTIKQTKQNAEKCFFIIPKMQKFVNSFVTTWKRFFKTEGKCRSVPENTAAK